MGTPPTAREWKVTQERAGSVGAGNRPNSGDSAPRELGSNRRERGSWGVLRKRIGPDTYGGLTKFISWSSSRRSRRTFSRIFFAASADRVSSSSVYCIVVIRAKRLL